MLATTIVLAIFTAVLAGATIWYAIETRRNVKVSREQIQLTKYQLISDFRNMAAPDDPDKATLDTLYKLIRQKLIQSYSQNT